MNTETAITVTKEQMLERMDKWLFVTGHDPYSWPPGDMRDRTYASKALLYDFISSMFFEDAIKIITGGYREACEKP